MAPSSLLPDPYIGRVALPIRNYLHLPSFCLPLDVHPMASEAVSASKPKKARFLLDFAKLHHVDFRRAVVAPAAIYCAIPSENTQILLSAASFELGLSLSILLHTPALGINRQIMSSLHDSSYPKSKNELMPAIASFSREAQSQRFFELWGWES